MLLRRLLWIGIALWPHLAHAADDAACQAAIALAERKYAIPRGVMGTIAMVESGRPVGKRVIPWPWSINAAGAGQVFASKSEAIAAVQTLQAAGLASIDVGCMQINLAAHPEAFPSLDAAFDPVSNADYAARFLRTLFAQLGPAVAMTAYHSQTPEFASDYARRLLSVWPGAADLGLTADPDLPPPPEPPSPYTAHLERELAENRTALRRHAPQPLDRTPNRSRIDVVSARGAAWPIGTP